MEVQLTLKQGLGTYSVVKENNKSISLDGGAFFGAEEGEFRPTELLLASLGGCAALDVGLILSKQKLPTAGLKVTVNGQRAEEGIPKRFVAIQLHFLVHPGVPMNKAEKAIELSVFKYCTIAASLNPDITITTSVSHYEME